MGGFKDALMAGGISSTHFLVLLMKSGVDGSKGVTLVE